MITLILKVLIILLSISGTPSIFTDAFTFIFMLLAITVTAICQYYNIKKLTFFLVGSYTVISLFNPAANVFLPVLFFDLSTHLPLRHTIFLPLVFLVTSHENGQTVFFHVMLGLVALVLAHLFSKVAELDSVNKELRDIEAAQKNILTMKNQKLIERQSDALHMTKLQERNRIARDIHDTIGHSLSRALLQTGALSAINKDASMQAEIDALKDTLTHSMNSIRNGVHDLKDDAIDLKSSISQLLKDSGFKISFNYDVEGVIPNDIKNCLLNVLKESITNTRKHSDANKISVRVAEHPAMYQFLVTDNGTQDPLMTGNGIGLQNIHERVNELNGYCRMNYQGGFRTFITIPKRDETS